MPGGVKNSELYPLPGHKWAEKADCRALMYPPQTVKKWCLTPFFHGFSGYPTP